MANLTLPILKGSKAGYQALAVKDPEVIYLLNDAPAGEPSVYMGTIGIADRGGKVVKGVEFDETEQMFTFTYTDDSTFDVDLPLESVIQDVDYNSTTKMLTFTLVSGATTEINLADLIDIYTGGSSTTATVDITNGVITSDVKISSDLDNVITVETDGLKVQRTIITGEASTSATTTVTDGTKVKTDVKVSTAAGNALKLDAEGLFVDTAISSDGSETDTATTTVTYNSTTKKNDIEVDVKVSAETGNYLEAKADGLFVPEVVTTSVIEDVTPGTDVPNVAAIRNTLTIGSF